jgi:DNA-binding response OmpR family regulator
MNQQAVRRRSALGRRLHFILLALIVSPADSGGEIEAVNCANDPAEHEISFGPFRLLATRRLLLEGNERVHLGSRALDLLIAFVSEGGARAKRIVPFENLD